MTGIDAPRLFLIFAGFFAGVCLFFWAPALGERADAFNSAVLTVFSVLAGIQLAIFALLGAIRPDRFRLGTSIRAARIAIWRKRWRQLILFYCYLFVMIIIILNQAVDLGWMTRMVERIYVSLSVAVLVWSLGLPVALSSVQEESDSDE